MSHQNGSSDKRTVVDEGTSFKGTLSSSCPIDVRGRIEGDVETPSLTISASGAVHGRVKVGSVHSDGEIAGEFEADHVELAGSVKDNTVIRARSLEVKLSSERGRLQVIFGECELSVGDEPTEHVELPVVAEQAAAQAAPALAIAADAPAKGSDSAVMDSDIEEEVRHEAAASAAAASAEPADEDLDEEEDEAVAGPAEANERKPRRRRKAKNGVSDDAPLVGWSQPPSQPPPAS
ncbi:MAG TPA: polymer-forming cytoskeletal protein [Polyangiaceae bacterium]|jgi:cytoskeletal protein CcmA (bactofilin family)|nr:polymer-forming cytoskeletal protein [Polyangiaceae bacterium]